MARRRKPSVPLLTHAVGVDFGTTTTLVAEGRAGRLPHVFPVGHRGTSWIPSLVGLADDGSLCVGEAASDLPLDRVKRSIKRAITRDEETLTLGGVSFSVDDGIRALLAELAARARGDLDLVPGVVRLGCPAMWTGRQRKRLLDLAREAGLPVEDHTLIDEPVAAGVAWVNNRTTATRRGVRGKLLVFDMGGGTLDVALLDVHADLGETPEISVLSSWGLDEAGDALDAELAADLHRQLAERGLDVDSTPTATGVRAVVREAARDAKERLSDARDTPVAIRYPGLDLPTLQLSREQLEQAFSPQLKRAADLVWAVLRGAQVTHEIARTPAEIRALPRSALTSEVDHVLLVGGMSRVPAVAKMLDSMFPRAEISTDAGVGSDEAIVAGLAETMAYERINLHRPPFHFVLEYQDAAGDVKHLPVYEAHAPFYPPFLAMQRSTLYFEWRPDGLALPKAGLGFIRVFTAGGEQVRIAIDGQEEYGIRLQFGARAPAVLIYPNGRVLIKDGKGYQTEIMVPKWPVIRSKDHAVLYVQRKANAKLPDLGRPWMKDPLFLH
jgi:molecular chaperone DnaK (HSP70)